MALIQILVRKHTMLVLAKKSTETFPLQCDVNTQNIQVSSASEQEGRNEVNFVSESILI